MAQPCPVVVCLSASGLATAKRAAEAIGASLHGRSGRVDTEVTFTGTTDHVRTLFAAGHPVIGVCAAGILIRAIAPLLRDKRREPPVIAVAEDGSAVVPLLGGHHGANRLARELAGALAARPAITTAGDLAHGLALDDPPPGWRLANPDAAAGTMAALLAGAGIEIEGPLSWAEPAARPGPDPIRLVATQKPVAPGPRSLVYTPQTLALGVGCARNCPPQELLDLVTRTLSAEDLAAGAIAGVFSVDLKADEPAVLALADHLDVEARFFSSDRLEIERPRLANPSDIVFAEVGCHGVAEGAALAAAGELGQLIVEKRKSANATMAIAMAPEPVRSLPGQVRGCVSLVGIGPGQAEWRTPEASRLIAEADELVGYGFYIDLLGPAAAGKARTDFSLGDEEARCRHALEEAGKGRHVALICSGDAGIYAMGALVYELMARTEGGVSAAARRVEVITAPGISALQAAAARAGAPIGHDFCAISLSDLLTPREDILRRIRAAAEGDFVIAFYNPASERRKDLFVNAIQMLLAHRPVDTPVIIASNLGRTGERVALRLLNEVSVDEIDMMTLVLVGSSQSRLVGLGTGSRMFTPRGYARKTGFWGT